MQESESNPLWTIYLDDDNPPVTKHRDWSYYYHQDLIVGLYSPGVTAWDHSPLLF